MAGFYHFYVARGKWSRQNRISHPHWVKICDDHNSQINLLTKQKYEVLSATFYCDTKVKVRSLDRDKRFRHCCWSSGSRYISTISVDNLLRLRTLNSDRSHKARSKRYLVETFTDTDNTNDIALLANTLNQSEFLLDSLEKAAGDIGLHVNVDKTEYMIV